MFMFFEGLLEGRVFTKTLQILRVWGLLQNPSPRLKQLCILLIEGSQEALEKDETKKRSFFKKYLKTQMITKRRRNGPKMTTMTNYVCFLTKTTVNKKNTRFEHVLGPKGRINNVVSLVCE